MFSRLVGCQLLRNAPLLASRPPSALPRRTLHASARHHAAEADNKEAFFQAFQKTSIFEKLASHPEAVVALEDFAKTLQAKGIDLTSGKPLSTLQMIKLASTTEFREGAKRVAEELEKAGVDMKSKEVLDEVMALVNIKRS